MIYIDVESYSELDIREVGTHAYWAHPSTRLLVVCWAEDDGPVRTWTWQDGTPPLFFYGRLMVAHNAEFEMCALNLQTPMCDWKDTAAQAAMCGLPRGLDKAAAALGLPVRKDKRGAYLIQRLSKPQRPSRKNPATLPWEKFPNYKELLAEFAAYCEQDVEVTRALHQALPPLPLVEQQIYDLTVRMNSRGVAVDRETVRAARRIIDHIEGDKGALFRELTGGLEYTQRDAVLAWLAERGVEMETLDKAAVAAALRRHSLPDNCRQVLELRQALAKSSTAKLDSILARGTDGRVRGNLVYHGAATGRWSGSGLQVQNIKRAGGLDMDILAHNIRRGDIEWLEVLYGAGVKDTLATAMRGMLWAEQPDHVLAGADFSQIEAREVLWLAGDPGLELFAGGADIYVEMATEIGKGSTRQLGKQAILGCGFGMGPPKFRTTCAGYGIEIDETLAKRAVTAYRTKFPQVPRLWYACESAALSAVRNPGRAYRVDMGPGLVYKMEGIFLTCRLPSGRLLYYPFPEIGPGKYGESLSYMGVDSKTKAWRREDTYGGKLVENNAQGIARDLMALALLRLDRAGYPPVMSVHDEAVCEVPEDTPTQALVDLMCALPPWAAGLPIKAEGFSDRRYS